MQITLYIVCCGCYSVMVLNATFNNISVIAWQSVLLVEETRGHRENYRPVASHWQTLSNNNVSSTPRRERIQTHKFSCEWKTQLDNVYECLLYRGCTYKTTCCIEHPANCSWRDSAAFWSSVIKSSHVQCRFIIFNSLGTISVCYYWSGCCFM